MSRFAQSLQQLLPTGFAWPRNPRSVLMRVLHGVAAAFDELHQFVFATAQQWLPHQTTLRLREWEEACGLPDGCMGPDQTEAERRAALMARLRGMQLPYTDSSHAALAVIRSVCAELGYEVRHVAYNTPLRVGIGQVGQRLGQLDGKLYVLVNAVARPMRVGDAAGSRLVTDAKDLWLLLCYLRRIVPARYEVIVLRGDAP